MPYYKDITGYLHYLDDASFAHLLPAGCVEISDAEAEEIRAASAPPLESLPLRCSPWQMRKALNQLGLRAGVEAAVAGADQTTKDGWEFATEFVRDDDLVQTMGAALGKTEAEMDQLFALAASL